MAVDCYAQKSTYTPNNAYLPRCFTWPLRAANAIQCSMLKKIAENETTVTLPTGLSVLNSPLWSTISGWLDLWRSNPENVPLCNGPIADPLYQAVGVCRAVSRDHQRLTANGSATPQTPRPAPSQSQSLQCINWNRWKVSIILAIRLF